MLNSAAALAAGILFTHVVPAAAAAKCVPRDPFKVVDPQNWQNPDDMKWDEWKAPPGTNWADPSRRGSIRNFNIALVTVDFPDQDFIIQQPAGSHIFGNPTTAANSLQRSEVPAFYRDFLNKPSELNHGHTIHEYWMEDSFGRFGVDLTVFGAYRMPLKSFQYGVDDSPGGFNPGACPEGETCGFEIRDDSLAAWREDVGNDTADAFELVFIMSAGHDESSTWSVFGEQKFQTPEDVTPEFGPPGNGTDWANTRYVGKRAHPRGDGFQHRKCENTDLLYRMSILAVTVCLLSINHRTANVVLSRKAPV
jgi:M6 family metalloprotease-like protein